MSTLTMALAAALLAGNAPEKVSGEVQQRLDLSGEWEGTYQDSKGTRVVQVRGMQDEGKDEDTIVCVTILPHTDPRFPPGALWRYRNEGNGAASFEYLDGTRLLARFSESAGRVVLCIRKDGQAPTSFRVGRKQEVLTLYHTKRP